MMRAPARPRGGRVTCDAAASTNMPPPVGLKCARPAPPRPLSLSKRYGSMRCDPGEGRQGSWGRAVAAATDESVDGVPRGSFAEHRRARAQLAVIEPHARAPQLCVRFVQLEIRDLSSTARHPGVSSGRARAVTGGGWISTSEILRPARRVRLVRKEGRDVSG
jgi:hypothetical protein